MAEPILRDDIEYLIHCDERGRIIGPISKTHAHLPGVRSVLTHYATWSMVFHQPSGKYGIQRKNPKKSDMLGAGRWDMGVAGHNCYVDDRNGYRPMGFKETLVKEANEEIGLEVEVVNSISGFVKRLERPLRMPMAVIFETFHYATERFNEFVGLAFILTPTTAVKFNDDEVVEFKWLSPKALRRYIMEGNDYCEPLPLVFEKAEGFRKRYLPRV